MQLSSTIVKSSESPLVATLLKNTDAEPVFVAVIVCGALVVPVSCEAKVSELGENETAGPVTARALPAPNATTATETTTNPSSGSSRRPRRVALPARRAELTSSSIVNDLPIDRIITIPPSISCLHAKTASHEVRIPPYEPGTLGGFLAEHGTGLRRRPLPAVPTSGTTNQQRFIAVISRRHRVGGELCLTSSAGERLRAAVTPPRQHHP